MNFKAGTMVVAMLAASLSALGTDTLSQAPPTLQVREVQLSYVASENIECPRLMSLRAVALTNGPGRVQFIIRKAGGGKSEPYVAQSVRGADGQYAARYAQRFSISANTRTKYMAEVVGTGKISPWIDFDETCGPQVRTGTRTTAAPPRQGRHVSERAPLVPAGEGKPVPRGAGKPVPDGDDGSRPIPGSDTKRLCRSVTITSQRVMAKTRLLGLKTAWMGWEAEAGKQFGSDFSDPRHASNRQESCSGFLVYQCTVSARPCHSGS